MTTPRTIDNLGMETSIRWAKDQALLEVAPIKEGSAVTQLTEIDISQPSYTSEFEQLFGEVARQSTWAQFTAPLGFNEQKKKLFTYEAVPILGSEEHLELQITRVKGSKVLKEEEAETRVAWETQKESEEEEKEKNIILTLMDKLQYLNRFLMDINSRRIQYLKG